MAEKINGASASRGYLFEWWIGGHPPRHVHVSDQNGNFLGRVIIESKDPLDDWKPPKKVLRYSRTRRRRSFVKVVNPLKRPFGKAVFSPIKNARYLQWEDAFEVEFEDGLSFLESHEAIRSANKIRPDAKPVRVAVEPELRHGFVITYDNQQQAEVSWAFVRELPPKSRSS